MLSSMTDVRTKRGLTGSSKGSASGVMTVGDSEVNVGFEGEVRVAAEGMQSAMRGVIGRLPERIRRAVDVARQFEVDGNLAAGVFRVLTVEDVLVMATAIPGSPSMRRLLESMRRMGLAEELVGELERASERFEAIVKRHAGNRAEFGSMISALVAGKGGEERPAFGIGVAEAAEAINLRHRKMMFGGMSHFAGVQLGVKVGTIISKGIADGRVERLHLRHNVGWRRLRQDCRLVVDLLRPSEKKTEEMRPLDAAAAAEYGASLLPEFSTKPLPTLNTRVVDHAKISELTGSTVGRTGAVDLAFGDLIAPMELKRDEQGRFRQMASVIFSTPTELCVNDYIVHRPTFGELREQRCEAWLSPQALYQPELKGVLPRLEMGLRVVQVSQGIERAKIEGVERYEEMLAFAMESQGWDPREFDVYRVRIEYPLVNSYLSVGLYFK